MKKDNTVKENDVTAATGENERSEVEILREQLVEERARTQALSRQAVQLASELEAAHQANNDRIENRMIGIINTNADTCAAKEKKAAKRNAKAMALEKAFMQYRRINVALFWASAVAAIAVCSCLLFGFIDMWLFVALAVVTLPVAGWTAHNCSMLSKFGDILKW